MALDTPATDTPSQAELDFYRTPGPLTDLTTVAHLLGEVPTDPPAVAAMVQGLVMHPFWAVAYDVEFPPHRMADLQIRSAAATMQSIFDRDPQPMDAARAPAERSVGNCRHFSTLTVALLRHVGVPARARCGFGGAFDPPKWVDHWVVEHWNGQRWVMLDPQIDQLQLSLSALEDPTDLTLDEYLPAGEAWMRCQRGELDGNNFGILDEWGQWFITGNMVRDLAALNKVEMLPWDGWGTIAGHEDEAHDEQMLDALAALTMSGDFAAIRARYASGATVRAGDQIISLGPDGQFHPVTVAELV